MVFNRELQEVEVLWFSKTKDSYGQYRQDAPTVQNIEMVCKIYSQSNVEDPRYVDIDVIGLTEERTITTENEIVIKENDFGIPTGTYIVKYVIPSSRLYQILMKRK